MKINESLRRFRKEKKLSQIEICQILNIRQQQYSRYESGLREIKSGQIKTICEHYNVSADYLLGLTDEYKPFREMDAEE